MSVGEDNENQKSFESILLSLNSEFAFSTLGWKSSLQQKKALQLTLDWWIQVEKQKQNVSDVTRSQISQYLESLNA
jgi:dTDP-D-glucose 4,6-dehydratase